MSERLTKRKEYGCACWNGDQNLVTHRRYSEMLEALAKYEDVLYDADGNEVISLARLRELAKAEREGRVVVLPCKVGDTVWVLRNYSGVIMPMSGIVEEMNFTRWSNPHIVVHGIGRGRWGEKIFATASEARRALAATEPKGDATT